MDPLSIRKVKAALKESTPVEDALLKIATELREEGCSQPELYRLFSYFQRRLSPEDPCYDAVVDILDLVHGGPWAKGRELFTSQLAVSDTNIHPPEAHATWRIIAPPASVALEQELLRELGPGHALAGRGPRALMRREDCDEVLFALSRSPQVVLVHLTWSGVQEQHGFPTTRLFESMLDWYDEVETCV